MEHVWSHVLGYLYGAYISTAIIAVCLLVYDWRLAIACLWGRAGGLRPALWQPQIRQPRRRTHQGGRHPRLRRHQEALENVREIRATNQEARYLAG